MRNAWHTFQLGLKEIVSLARDPVLLFLIAYSFTFSIYTPSKSAVMDVVNELGGWIFVGEHSTARQQDWLDNTKVNVIRVSTANAPGDSR